MKATDIKRARELSQQVRAFSNGKGQKKKKERPLTLSQRVAGITQYKSPIQTAVISTEKRVYLGKPGDKGADGVGIPGKDGRHGRDGLPGKTPVKGVDYFTDNEIQAIKKMILTELAVPRTENEAPKIAADFEVTPEMVKKIIGIMHTLPEMDKLEVSKGVRNAQSFIYGGTKYKMSELMHGGSSASSSSSTSVYGEVVAGSGTAWTLAHTPDTNTLRLFANGQRLMAGTDYTLAGTAITTVLSWDAGTLLADYNYV